MQGMSFDPNKSSLNPRISDIDRLPGAKRTHEKWSPRAKALAVASLALTGAFGASIAHELKSPAKHAVTTVSPNSDRAFNPALSNPRPLPETSLDPSGVSKELKAQEKAQLEKLNQEQPTTRYKVVDGDSPAAIVERSTDADGNPITDTVQYAADVAYIQQQIPEGDQLHPDNMINLPPGLVTTGSTVPIQPTTQK
jgi:hypothetical protein